jgi:hypothetical protein
MSGAHQSAAVSPRVAPRLTFVGGTHVAVRANKSGAARSSRVGSRRRARPSSNVRAHLAHVLLHLPSVAGCLQVPPSSLLIGTPVGSAGFPSSRSAITPRCALAPGRAATAPPCPCSPPVRWSTAPPPAAARHASCLPFPCSSSAMPSHRHSDATARAHAGASCLDTALSHRAGTPVRLPIAPPPSPFAGKAATSPPLSL